MEKYGFFFFFISKKHCGHEEFLSRRETDSTLFPPPLHPLAHRPTTPIPQARPGVGNGGVRRVHQGNTSPANITTVVEMQYWRNLFTLNILAANVLTQIVPYSSSLYTVCHSVIFNSVVFSMTHSSDLLLFTFKQWKILPLGFEFCFTQGNFSQLGCYACYVVLSMGSPSALSPVLQTSNSENQHNSRRSTTDQTHHNLRVPKSRDVNLLIVFFA